MRSTPLRGCGFLRRRWAQLGIAITFLCYLCGAASADRVTPTDKVKKGLTVYRSARTSAKKVGVLRKGEFAQLVTNVKPWRKVRLADGTVGYVSCARTRVLPDPVATAATMSVVHRRVATVADIPTGPPVAARYRLDMFDVGTGLSILIQGHTFNMLFDGGSNDRAEEPDRLLAYLFAAIGPSGGANCVPEGDSWSVSNDTLKIDYLVLSHPHADHGSALARVLQCYAVGNIWDSGAVNHTVFYRKFIQAVAAETGVVYHTAIDVPSNKTITVKGTAIALPSSVTWSRFHEKDVVKLDDDATFEILHADGSKRGDFNQNSIVLHVDLGGVKVLLTGDAESGTREDPDADLGDIEKHLVDTYPTLIDVDILQVGHHGSKTSSRQAFLDAVTPSIALISSGPRKYGSVTLPDAAIEDALKAMHVELLETTEHDKAGCPEDNRVGLDDSDTPGGCDGYVIEISPTH